MQPEFHILNADDWRESDPPSPELPFTDIGPTAPFFTNEGAANIRFAIAAEFAQMTAEIVNVDTGEKVECFDICHFASLPLGPRSECTARPTPNIPSVHGEWALIRLTAFPLARSITRTKSGGVTEREHPDHFGLDVF
jgi:hypothetical protein